MNQSQDRDPLLNKLLRQATIHEPSADFTRNIMDIIQQTEQEQVVKMSFFIRYSYWIIAVCITICLIAVAIYFPSFIKYPQIQNMQNFFNSIVNTIESITILLKSQSIIGVVIIALSGLFLIDKLLSRIFHPTVQHS